MMAIFQAIPGVVYLVKKIDQWIVTPIMKYFKAKEVSDRNERYEKDETQHTENTETIKVEANKPATPDSDAALRNAHRQRYNEEGQEK